MKTKHLITTLLCTMLLTLTSCAKEDMVLNSPNGELTFEISAIEGGGFAYSLLDSEQTLIESSRLGFEVNDSDLLASDGWSACSITKSDYDGVWTPLWGKRGEVVDRYREMTISLCREGENTINRVEIKARAYDDGVAFRYIIPNDENSTITLSRECTEYNFAGDYTAWFYNKENHNIGPERLSESKGARLPVMTIKVSDSKYMAIHEADLLMGAPLILTSKSGETKFSVSSIPAEITGEYTSAWRAIFYGTKPGEMVDSHLLELLCEDPDPKYNFSEWVTPGVALWDWRINGAKLADFTYEMSYPSWIRMVDFAVENQIPSLVLDANWYGPEFDKDSNPMVGDKANDVKRLITYAKERGVGIWLYLNDVGGRKFPIEETLKQYGSWGAFGVKYGFMKGNPTEKLARTQMITRICAENRLHVNYHDGPVHPYGQMRTWPNALTREYCQAQLDGHKVFQPSTFVTSVFVNMLAGPLDMNNGMFDLRQGNTDRVDENQPVPSTLVSEAARTAIVFSGATVIPDIPEMYRKYPSLLRFIAAQKMAWVDSRTLGGEIGEYVVMMRETESHYLVSAAVNESGMTLDIPMEFLPQGEFDAELTTDGEGAHYLHNREVLDVQRIKVSSSTQLRVKLAEGGGVCLLIEKR